MAALVCLLDVIKYYFLIVLPDICRTELSIIYMVIIWQIFMSITDHIGNSL